MAEPRLTARFWVDAYLTRLRLADIPAFVVKHGDDTAGSIVVKQSPLDGSATLSERVFDFLSEAYAWREIARGEEREIDDQIARARARDPDLWVIEVEDREGRALLGEPGL